MVQREVGDVLLAQPGEEAWSTLTIAARSRWRVRRAFDVGASKFHPRPDVESSVMVLERHEDPPPHPDFFPFVRRLFQARRKALRGVLSKALGSERTLAALAAAGIAPEERPDRLAVDALARLHLELGAPSGW
jgi:16S rRNA (adenine1518-N6/adenine1519-N6)-dimethyltransferase